MLPFAPAAIRSGQKTSKNTCSLPMFNRRTMNNPEKKSKGVLETVHQTKQMKQKNQPQPTIFFWGGGNCSHAKQQQKRSSKKNTVQLACCPLCLGCYQPLQPAPKAEKTNMGIYGNHNNI